MTTPVHNRKLMDATLDIGGLEIGLQMNEFTLDPGIADGKTTYTFGGSYVETDDPEPKLKLKLTSDWRAGAINRYLWEHSDETVPFQLDLHPNTVGEHVRWNGSLQIKAPAVGGEARKTEVTEIELTCTDVPAISYP